MDNQSLVRCYELTHRRVIVPASLGTNGTKEKLNVVLRKLVGQEVAQWWGFTKKEGGCKADCAFNGDQETKKSSLPWCVEDRSFCSISECSYVILGFLKKRNPSASAARSERSLESLSEGVTRV